MNTLKESVRSLVGNPKGNLVCNSVSNSLGNSVSNLVWNSVWNLISTSPSYLIWNSVRIRNSSCNNKQYNSILKELTK